jgi:hypothetical protein
VSILASVTHEKWKIQEDIAFRVLRLGSYCRGSLLFAFFFFFDYTGLPEQCIACRITLKC